jgi:membrane protein
MIGLSFAGRRFRLKQVLADVRREWSHDRLGMVAGALTFSGVLALFPFLLFVLALAALVIDPAETASLVDGLRDVAPPAVADLLTERIHSLTRSGSPGLLTLGAVGAVWAASGGVEGLTDALDTVYDVEDSRPWWKVRGRAVLVTIAAAVGSVLAAVIAIATPAVVRVVGDPIGTVLSYARIPVAAVLMTGVLAFLYWVLPDVEQRFRFLTPGSVVATVLWAVASWLFSIYVSHFGSYEVSYGALGGVIVLLVWMWITSVAVLLGAEINCVIERQSPEAAPAGARPTLERAAPARGAIEGAFEPEAARDRAFEPERVPDRAPAPASTLPVHVPRALPVPRPARTRERAAAVVARRRVPVPLAAVLSLAGIGLGFVLGHRSR